MYTHLNKTVMKLSDLESRPINGGVQYIFKSLFNNFGASIVQHKFSYGGKKGLYELAVLSFNEDGTYNLCYSTDITHDVLGYLTEEKVLQIINKISNLDKVGETNPE